MREHRGGTSLDTGTTATGCTITREVWIPNTADCVSFWYNPNSNNNAITCAAAVLSAPCRSHPPASFSSSTSTRARRRRRAVEGRSGGHLPRPHGEKAPNVRCEEGDCCVTASPHTHTPLLSLPRFVFSLHTQEPHDASGGTNDAKKIDHMLPNLLYTTATTHPTPNYAYPKNMSPRDDVNRFYSFCFA